ncbi:DUF1801 domain-containing protein [Thalassospira xiamenensis]|uniref:DUF1801 domain-containing protein n=1 Tax=Thalassospira xiamenensis TaxID=220697 RepID=UPI003AA9ADC5
MNQTQSFGIGRSDPGTIPKLAADLSTKFACYPDDARSALMTIRGWIFELAANIPIGMITETLKWGEPAWVTPSGSGTTIRADWKPKAPDRIAIYVNCQTDLIDRVRSHFDGVLECQGNGRSCLRWIARFPKKQLKPCLAGR